MPVLLNFKICDNAKECSSIEVCPTKAIFWNDKTGKIDIDNEKCIGCEECVPACPVAAVRFAANDVQYAAIADEIAKDTRTLAQLFVDRYGAAPIKEEYQKAASDVPSYLASQKGVIFMELFNPETVACLLESIPIKDVLKDRHAVSYIKVESDQDFAAQYGAGQLPSLIVFSNGDAIGKIEGHYGVLQTKELRQKLNGILGQLA